MSRAGDEMAGPALLLLGFAVTGKPAAKLYARTRGTLQVVEAQLTVEEYGYAIRKDEPELLRQFNDALKKLKADGTYQQLVNKYL